MKKRGISLILLIITMIIIIIMTGAIILTLGEGGILDQSTRARFMNDFRIIESSVNLHAVSNYNPVTRKFDLPLRGYLTDSDKTRIKEREHTLNTKIEQLSGDIDLAELAWISHEDMYIELSNRKSEKGYIMDVNTGQIYDYIGDFFEGLMWHTLDSGVLRGGTVPEDSVIITDELWEGWIKLTLYYPVNSTQKKWRLGTEGEVRADPMLMWQDYTGPITVPLDRVKDIWISYMIDNKEFIIPPAGTLLVDIVPDKTGTAKVSSVNVKINFDETATTKEYRVGNSGWMTYNGPFTVTENAIIEARARKTESIYNTDGSLLTTRNIAGRDIVYIGNIGVEEIDLPAPTITRLNPIGSEVARVQVTYPAEADRTIYKVNYGIEENYTDIIDVQNYGTHILAYYYDSNGKRSRSVGIRINDTTGGAEAEPPTPHDPKPSNRPDQLVSNDIPAPVIKVNPTSLVEVVQVSIESPANADSVYIKLGRYGSYEEYTGPISVMQNMQIYAYYRTYMGEKSNIGYGRVSNIKKKNMPYVNINANPYPWGHSYGEEEVNITIQYSDADTKEYSEDGIVYIPYTGPFTVYENKTIYARGINAHGVTETSLNITNIGDLRAPKPMIDLNININVNPEPALAEIRSEKAIVSIDYDIRSAEKYYSFGRYGTLIPYTGEFEVTENTTIYAYAKGLNAKGRASKKIDNLSSGIAEPVIRAYPRNKTQASKVNITIEYDKYATIKRYSIDGGFLRDYTGSFEVTKNGAVIYAYSENELGQKSEARYTIENIVEEPPTLLLDMGSYFILKLSYPHGSKAREYKWKADGEWKNYKESGILLIKPQYKDILLQDGSLIKIVDDTGKLVTFTGDYYLIDVPISEISEFLFMRWDREPLGAPQIIITPSEPAMMVTATIVYNPALEIRQYKIIGPNDTSGVWQNYTGPITIDRNNTIIYAKGMDDTEVWSDEGMAKVTNIDENPPVIKLTADLDTAAQKVAVRVSVTDDVGVGKVKWAAGVRGESYFATAGTEIPNNSVVNITSNGYYTFYAEDKVGNKQVYTLNVTNVDLTPPVIDIQVTPETTVGLTANVTIDYDDAVTKQYKIGVSNSTWVNYTSMFEISSYTILANNWQNEDGTVTIFAKGVDSSGNEAIVQKKIVSLDLDRPKTPIIDAKSNYAILTSYGAIFDSKTTITYDNRTDIDNYYSIDNGSTWKIYSGTFEMASGTVIAKSVKKTTGLEVTVSMTVAMPVDAMKPQAYDSDDSTYTVGTNQHLEVDSSMVGRQIRVRWYSYTSSSTIFIRFLREDRSIISSVSRGGGTYDDIYTIPQGTKWIRYDSNHLTSNRLFEIQPSNEPTFSATDGYMLLTADPTKSIREPYQMVTINYFPTSVQRLYRIGTSGNWLVYIDQPVKVNQGETIYTRGIDQYGNETRVISSYTSNVANAMDKEAFDGNDATFIVGTNKHMEVDSSMVGRQIRVRWYSYTTSSTIRILFLDENMNQISSVSRGGGTYDDLYTIPQGTKWIRFNSNHLTSNRLFEIQPSNEPTFSATNGYMLLTADPEKSIREPYQMVTPTYFPTSVQRLYRIGTSGDWLSYNDKAVWVKQGETLYTKGIDIHGNETRIISSYTANVPDAIKKEAFDGDDATFGNQTNQHMLVDSSMVGRRIRVRWSSYTSSSTIFIRFLREDRTIISFVSRGGGTYDDIYTIPEGTRWIRYDSNHLTSNRLFEIQPSNEPTFTPVNGYMLLTADPTKSIREPYQMVTINYFPTSVQRLYRIGTTGDWLTYNDEPIWVNQDATLYAKGIDEHGNETRIISSYTSNVPDAMKKEAFDGNDSTFGNQTNQHMLVDSSMVGRRIRVRWYSYTTSSTIFIRFLDNNMNQISFVSRGGGTYDDIYTIPEGTRWIRYDSNHLTSNRLFEIQPSNEPTFSTTNGYMLLHADLTKSIREPYQMVTIHYFPTSVQRLYRIGTTGNWLTYNNEPIWVNQDATLYAKGIDEHGNETRIISNHTANVPDAMKKEAFDGNDATFATQTNQHMKVDSSMEGRNIRVRWYSYTSSSTITIRFLNDNMNQISFVSRGGGTYDDIYTIPQGTRWIRYDSNHLTSNRLFEIQLIN